MKPGVQSTEFWLVVAVVAFAVLVTLGVLTPDRIETLSDSISETAEVLPRLISTVEDLAVKLTPLLIAAGAVWAYVKRRTVLKEKEEENTP